MDVDASIEQVTGILVREGLRYQMSEDRRTYRLLFGSAAVFIDFDTWQDDGVVITVHSPVLQDIDPESAGAAQALNLLNELNRSFFFVKFTFRDGILIARYDLLGDTLQAVELVNALYEIAGAADRLDDELAETLGGKPYEAKLSEWTGGLERRSVRPNRSNVRSTRAGSGGWSGQARMSSRFTRANDERDDVGDAGLAPMVRTLSANGVPST